MVGCTAPYCSAKSERGIKMFQFPNDASRRQLWIQNIGKPLNWQPSCHRLCEVNASKSK
jgi:hypothetical protein